MTLDITPAFENGNQGITIYRRDDGFMVSVKSALGGFVIGYGPTPADGLADALKLSTPDDDDDILGDLL